jgi:hypothetical protein
MYVPTIKYVRLRTLPRHTHLHLHLRRMILRAAVSRWLLGLVRLFVCLSSQESQRSQRRNSRVSRTSHSEESELLPLRTKIKFADSHACFRLDGTVGVGDGGAVGNRLTAYSMGSSSGEHAESMLWEMGHMDQIPPHVHVRDYGPDRGANSKSGKALSQGECWLGVISAHSMLGPHSRLVSWRFFLVSEEAFLHM